MGNAKITCPFCENEIYLWGEEYFKDELLNDFDSTDIKCKCAKDIPIKTECEYSFSVDYEALEFADE